MNYLIKFYNVDTKSYDERWIQFSGGMDMINEQLLKDRHLMYSNEMFDSIVRRR